MISKPQLFYIVRNDLLVLTLDGYVSIKHNKVVDIFQYPTLRTPLPHILNNPDESIYYPLMLKWHQSLSDWLISEAQDTLWTYLLRNIYFDTYGWVYFKRKSDLLDKWMLYCMNNEGGRGYGLLS